MLTANMKLAETVLGNAWHLQEHGIEGQIIPARLVLNIFRGNCVGGGTELSLYCITRGSQSLGGDFDTFDRCGGRLSFGGNDGWEHGGHGHRREQDGTRHKWYSPCEGPGGRRRRHRLGSNDFHG